MEFPSLVESLGLNSAFNKSLETLEPFAMLKGKCLTRKSFIKICKKESYTMPQYIPMLSPSHQLLITSLKKWISLLPVSHVNHFQEQVQENQLKTKNGYGIQYLKPLAKLNHRSYSWRTFQTSLMNGKHLMKFQNPFPKSASILNGQMYERPMLGPIIKETVCSSLLTNLKDSPNLFFPTPTKSDGVRTSMNYHSKNGGDGNLTLFGKVSQLPTPTASDPLKQTTGGLHRMIVQGRRKSNEPWILPTPTLDTSMRKKKYPQGGIPLSLAVKELNISHPNGGEKNRLSPLFVEWMMGFPTLWTDLEV
jgi:hypothetical protein